MSYAEQTELWIEMRHLPLEEALKLLRDYKRGQLSYGACVHLIETKYKNPMPAQR